jgi:hypothetical protein
MKCVLVANGVIAAVSECSGLPTISGWREAYPNEVYTIGEPADLFDKRMRRRPIDTTSMYVQATAEKQIAAERVPAARAGAKNAKKADEESQKARQLTPLAETTKSAEEKSIAHTAVKATGKKAK